MLLKKIKIKILRNLVKSIYGDKTKTEKIEYVFDGVEEDIDCQSLILALDKVTIDNICNLEGIIEIYKSLFPNREKQNLDRKAMENLVKYIDTSRKEHICKYIIKKRLFHEYTFIMMVLIYNNIQYRFEKYLTVFYACYEKHYYKYSHYSYQEFESIHKQALQENRKYYYEKKLYSLEEISSKLLQIKDNDLKSLSIEHMYIFGSYAKRTNDIYSDIDFLAYTDLDQGLVKTIEESLASLLYSIFLTDLDVHVISSKSELNNFETNILSYAIQVY